MTFDSEVTSSDEIIAIDGYNYDSVSADTITIGTGSNVINFYYTKRTDLTYTIKSTVADFALTSGSGADKITVDTSNNAQVKTGAGADTITVQNGAVSANIWGGAGNDIFDVKAAISSATQYVTIEDATSGDKILLKSEPVLSPVSPNTALNLSVNVI
jgi:Ca2+-binding RTX toxin-like protein